MTNQNIAIIGASGGLGSAFVNLFADDPSNTVYAFSRSKIKNESAHAHLTNIYRGRIDFADELSIKQAAEQSTKTARLDCVVVATGILHDTGMMPEKSLHDLSAENFERSFLANTIGPALVAKHFLPKIQHKQRTVFAALSARVGSISDNRLGGWYAYRASKCALNMIIKNAAIEMSRHNKQAIIVALHPGTVDSKLSQPFQANIPDQKLFTPAFAAAKLLQVLNNLTPQHSGQCLAWDGQVISP